MLLSHGCHKSISFLLREYEEENFFDTITTSDSLGDTVLNNIASAEDGPSQVRTLDLMYEFFQLELHKLFNISAVLDRIFLSVVESENLEFVSLFVRCFRNESEIYLGNLILAENIISHDLTEVARFISLELNEIYS